jgi:hypothetical protein
MSRCLSVMHANLSGSRVGNINSARNGDTVQRENWVRIQVGTASVLLLCSPIIAVFAVSMQRDEQSVELDPDAEAFLLEISAARFDRPSQQKEAFEYLWTPGIVLQQMLDDDPKVAYPLE